MTASPADRMTVLPPQDLEEMLDLSKFLDQVEAPAALVGPDGQTVGIPGEVFDALAAVTRAMTEGKAIAFVPVDQLLTTQEAADFLGISRPTFVKVLESGQLPFERPGAGRHRRVRLKDVLDYQERRRAERRELLDQMTEDATSDGLYEPVDYSEALRRARKLKR